MPPLPSECTYQLPVAVQGLQYYHHPEKFELELEGSLPHLTIGYHTYGKLNAQRNNVIWVCHALTANSEVAAWWDGLYGEGNVLDPAKYFIVCANILGSCYGTTCPRSRNPETGEPYGLQFPLFTIRDIVRVHSILCKHLNINQIALCIGGSCGGHQVLEMACKFVVPIKRIVLLVTSARETAWAIAIHEAGRMTLEADPSFNLNKDDAGADGLKAARAIGLLAYRTSDSYIAAQTDNDERTDAFRSSSYMRYQGYKLQQRFYAHCYWYLLKSLDTHHLGRGRGSLEEVLQEIKIPALVIAMDTDQLIPPSQQQFIANHLANATYCELNSAFGHDGFLIEAGQIRKAIQNWLSRC